MPKWLGNTLKFKIVKTRVLYYLSIINYNNLHYWGIKYIFRPQYKLTRYIRIFEAKFII